jgi:replicative DNA helicase
MSELNPVYLEQVITKTMLADKDYAVSIVDIFIPDYFDSPAVSEIFKCVKSYFTEYKELPNRSILLNSIPATAKEEVENHLKECDAIDLDIAKHYDWIFENTNNYLKDKAVKNAMTKGIDIIEEKGNPIEIRKLLEEALCKDLKIDLGLDYFGTLRERLNRIFTQSDDRIPTYFPTFDGFLNGGFPPRTLSVLVAKIHAGKSNMMANIIARQVEKGHNVFLASLEMSEDMFAQRFDGIYSKLDINRMYFNTQLRHDLIKKLGEIKNKEGIGKLIIKSFPTGKASVADYRRWIRDLGMRGTKCEILYFDYLNLMQSEYGNVGQLYNDIKSVTEESRALAFEFVIPCVSVSQLNREGTFMDFKNVDFNSIADSLGIAATADFMMIMGKNFDDAVYESEIWYKIVKNRLGGMVGATEKFYMDFKSMKMYCNTELEQWIADATSSGDVREHMTRA